MKEELQVEIMGQVFDEAGVCATDDQIKDITRNFIDGLESIEESDRNAHIYIDQPCRECINLKKDISRLSKIIEIEIEKIKKKHSKQSLSIKIDNAKGICVEV